MNMPLLDSDKVRIASNIFSRPVIDAIAGGIRPRKVDKIINQLDINNQLKGKTYSFLFEWLYQELVSQYRNEYVYKNAIASKIVAGRSRFTNIAYFCEFLTWDVIADIVIVNGTTSAYEIKTEYDSFARLDNQIHIYQQVFDKVNVVIPESKIKSLFSTLPSNIGIIELSKQYTLRTHREAASNIDCLMPEKIFSCLRKDEYEKIIVKHFGSLPNVRHTLVRKHSAQLFYTLDINTIHSEFTQCLRDRQMKSNMLCLLRNSPVSLLSLIMTTKMTYKRLNQLVHNLDNVVLA